VVDRLGSHHIHTDHHLVRFAQTHGSGAWAEFVVRGTQTGVGRVEADLLVGCDGIHSTVRRTVHPDEGPPRWNGVIMWRGVTFGEPFLSGRAMINAGSSKQRVVIYPISKVEEEQGRALINWVAILKTPADATMPPQDWTHVANREEVLEA